MAKSRPQRRLVDPKTGRLYRVRRIASPFTPPPPALHTAKLDNPVLVPASLLPFKTEYQAVANQQPPGTTLVVLPSPNNRQRRTLETVASRLRAKGRRVATVPIQQFSQAHH